MKKILLVALIGLAALSASAEKADANKTAVINYDSLDSDEVTQTTILTGNVILTKGTLVLKSDKAVIKETPEGYMAVTLTSNGAKSATFRQKRDAGPDLWMEGEAKRIEYDERNELVKLFAAAKVRQLEGAKVVRLVESEYLSYDSRKEVLVSRNDASGEHKPGMGRGTMILEPKVRRPAPATPAATPTPPATPATGTP